MKLILAVLLLATIAGCTSPPQAHAADLIPECNAAAPPAFVVNYYDVQEGRAGIAKVFAEKGWSDIDGGYKSSYVTANCRQSSRWA